MKENTVILSIEEYEILKKFKDVVENDDLICVEHSYECGKIIKWKFYSKSKKLKEMAEDISDMRKTIEKLRAKIRSHDDNKYKKLLDKVLDLSWWEFRKIKRCKKIISNEEMSFFI